MAKAGDRSSTIVWIWLWDAFQLAIGAFGSVGLADQRLTELLAAGKVPWDCMSWRGLDEEGLAKLRREQEQELNQRREEEQHAARERARGRRTFGEAKKQPLYRLPPATYHPGDPRFWSAGPVIDWQDNRAHHSGHEGALAMGIKVSREHLIAHLPEGPGDRMKELSRSAPAELKLKPKAWFAAARAEHPQQEGEDTTTYAHRLHDLMQTANVTKPWSFKTLLRRIYGE